MVIRQKEIQMDTNSRKTKTPIRTVMLSEAFKKGFGEAKNGLPFDYEMWCSMKEQYRYEKGRLFGLFYKGRLLAGRGISNKAIEAYQALKLSNTI
jgi:hypothetical protein